MYSAKSLIAFRMTMILAATMLAGCAEQVDPQRALSVKIGSTPSLVQSRIGRGNFDFQILVGNERYLGESRAVGYSGQYLFIYRNSQFVKICETPGKDLRRRPDWNYLASRAKLVLNEPGLTEIHRNKPPPPDPEEQSFFWNVILPVTVITLPAQPVFCVYAAIQYESEQPIRDFYQGHDIRLNQEAAAIDQKKFGSPVVIGKYGSSRFIERFSQKQPVRDSTPCLDVMVENGRVEGFFAVAADAGIDDSAD